jgi:hypothetical protein
MVAATRPIPETSCISTHTMENVQRNTDIKTQVCLYLSTFLTQGPANSAGQFAVRDIMLYRILLHTCELVKLVVPFDGKETSLCISLLKK